MWGDQLMKIGCIRKSQTSVIYFPLRFIFIHFCQNSLSAKLRLTHESWLVILIFSIYLPNENKEDISEPAAESKEEKTGRKSLSRWGFEGEGTVWVVLGSDLGCLSPSLCTLKHFWCRSNERQELTKVQLNARAAIICRHRPCVKVLQSFPFSEHWWSMGLI